MAATAAIFHHPDAVESPNTPLAGRRTAGQSFLEGYARYAEAESLHCAAGAADHIEHFRKLMAAYGWTGEIHGALSHDPAKLGAPGVLQVPGPSLGSFAWTRRRAGQRHYSLCGITHTVSTRRIMQGLFEVLTAPVENWDAIICTSNAVQGVVAAEMDEAEDYLRQRLAARRVPRPSLPVIPLGIDAGRFARSDTHRAKWRATYDLAEDDIAVMSMGRLTFPEKLHPGPLMIALQRATQETGRRIVLWMVGWFGDEVNERLHRRMAEDLCPDVDVHFPDGKDADLRYEIWSAADIFTLPVDNIQETFGLAPVEAMAAGLPVVCSDWNGFKDTVEDGVTGMRVRTLMAPPGSGAMLAHRHAENIDNYHQYLSSAHQRTVVDVPEMAAAFTALINDPERRRQMGEAGQARVRQLYDWSVIIPQYQALWAELGARRARDMATSPVRDGAATDPTAMDPFTLYRGYPTTHPSAESVLVAEVETGLERIKLLMEITGAVAVKRMVARAEDLATIQKTIVQHGPVRFGDLLARTKASEGVMLSSILWLAKFDLIEIRT